MPQPPPGATSRGRRFRAIPASRGFCRSWALITRSKMSFIDRQTALELSNPPKTVLSGETMKIDKSQQVQLEELTQRGASRRDVLRALAAGGVMSLTGAG